MEKTIARGSAVSQKCTERWKGHWGTSFITGCLVSLQVDVRSPREQRWNPGMQGHIVTIEPLLRFCHGGNMRHIAALRGIPLCVTHNSLIISSPALRLRPSPSSDQNVKAASRLAWFDSPLCLLHWHPSPPNQQSIIRRFRKPSDSLALRTASKTNNHHKVPPLPPCYLYLTHNMSGVLQRYKHTRGAHTIRSSRPN